MRKPNAGLRRSLAGVFGCQYIRAVRAIRSRHAPRDEPHSHQTSNGPSAHHAERDGYVAGEARVSLGRAKRDLPRITIIRCSITFPANFRSFPLISHARIATHCGFDSWRRGRHRPRGCRACVCRPPNPRGVSSRRRWPSGRSPPSDPSRRTDDGSPRTLNSGRTAAARQHLLLASSGGFARRR